MKTHFAMGIAILLIAWLSSCSRFDPAEIELPSTDAETVHLMAAEIAEFDLPSGFQPDFSVKMTGYTLASYTLSERVSHLYLIQSDDYSDGDKLAQVLTELKPGIRDPKSATAIIQTRQVTVRNTDTTLIISDGINGDGAAYRQALAAFDGKNGPALLVFSQPIDLWDDAALNNLLASIR
jgi:hypothetical protein